MVKQLICVIAAVGSAFCCVIPSPALGELLILDWHVPGDSLITRDSETGFEWLDLTASAGRSYNYMSSQFGPDGEFECFRYATRAEIVSLWTHAGIVNID